MREPTEIKRLGTEGIQVSWSDGTVHRLSSQLLRSNCPSASSKAERGEDTHSSPLTPKETGRKGLNVIKATIDESLSLTQIWPVGNYAIGLEWGDGHNTGIYSFNFLFELGEQAASSS